VASGDATFVIPESKKVNEIDNPNRPAITGHSGTFTITGSQSRFVTSGCTGVLNWNYDTAITETRKIDMGLHNRIFFP
jgi:hypothetical protein